MAETATDPTRYTFTGQEDAPPAPAEAAAPPVDPDVPPPDSALDADDDSSELAPDETAAPDAPGQTKVPGWQRRIDRQTKRNHALEAQLQAQAAQIETLTKIVSGQQQPTETTAPPGKPTADQYPAYETYLEALAEWTSEQKAEAKFAAWTQAQAEAQQRQAQEAQARSQLDAWAQTLAAAQARHPDFHEVIEAADVQVAQHLLDEVRQSPHGGEVFYYLAQHPHDALRLSGLQGRAFYREFEALETTVAPPQSSAVTAGPPARTETPSAVPIRPVGGASAPARTLDPETMSYQDYKAARRAKRL